MCDRIGCAWMIAQRDVGCGTILEVWRFVIRAGERFHYRIGVEISIGVLHCLNGVYVALNVSNNS